MVLTSLFKKFSIDYIIALMKDLLGQLNIYRQRILEYFLFIIHYPGVTWWIKTPKKWPTNIKNAFFSVILGI